MNLRAMAAVIDAVIDAVMVRPAGARTGLRLRSAGCLYLRCSGHQHRGRPHKGRLDQIDDSGKQDGPHEAR